MKKFYIEIKKRTSVFTIYLVYHIKKLMVFNNKETVISNITCNGKLKEHHRGPLEAALLVRRFSDVAKFWGALEGRRRVVGRGVGGVWGGRGEEGGRGRQVRVGLGELRVVRLSKRTAHCCND